MDLCVRPRFNEAAVQRMQDARHCCPPSNPFDALKQFVDETLVLGLCSPKHKQSCNAEQLKLLEDGIAMPLQLRKTKIAEIENQINVAEEAVGFPSGVC